MVFECEGRAEQRHDAVAHDLVDRAVVAMDCFHHAFEHRIKDFSRFLRIAIGKQLHRAFEIGK